MARYLVSGANRTTGDSIAIVIESESATIAEREAQSLGILVADVRVDEPGKPMPAVGPTPPASQQAASTTQDDDPARALLKLAGFTFMGALGSLAIGSVLLPDGGLTLFSICMLVATLLLAFYGLARVAGFVTK